ncbi:hypothetical protein MPH_03825 [Macrophomina phaseolina MS6]|uniref:Transmembrane protein n=1 Tax=Macrophomina phaseolina (strain MS6) TaxID=1126212 RepID=K2R907_MACPH|nr:hypothetical protein MPH_03825 [Macrophomina phaseolina MS6]
MQHLRFFLAHSRAIRRVEETRSLQGLLVRVYGIFSGNFCPRVDGNSAWPEYGSTQSLLLFLLGQSFFAWPFFPHSKHCMLAVFDNPLPEFEMLVREFSLTCGFFFLRSSASCCAFSVFAFFFSSLFFLAASLRASRIIFAAGSSSSPLSLLSSSLLSLSSSFFAGDGFLPNDMRPV